MCPGHEHRGMKWAEFSAPEPAKNDNIRTCQTTISILAKHPVAKYMSNSVQRCDPELQFPKWTSHNCSCFHRTAKENIIVIVVIVKVGSQPQR